MTTTIEWKDIRENTSEVDVCHEEARLGGHTACIFAPDRRKPGMEYSVDVGGTDTFHRTHDQARRSAERRLVRAAS